MAISGVSAVGALAAQTVSAPPAAAATSPTFDQMLGQVVDDAVGAMQAGESAARRDAGVQGGRRRDGGAARLAAGAGDPRQGGIRLSGNLAHGDLTLFARNQELLA